MDKPDWLPPTKSFVMTTPLCKKLPLRYPIIQAPMAGVSTPELAAAVSNAGALGSLGLGASSPEEAARLIRQTQALTRQPFNVNLFCHSPAIRHEAVEQAWIARFADRFAALGAQAPVHLEEIYPTFCGHEAMLQVIEETRPAVVSFHFGLPPADTLRRLKACRIVTLATATSVAEAEEIAQQGIDMIVAQGYEAGGHRGSFAAEGDDHQLSTLTLIQAINARVALPVIAAGGIMNGAAISAMLALGASGVQSGTAFLLCPESATTPAWRQALRDAAVTGTTMTAAISGREARCLRNTFCKIAHAIPRTEIPAYPLAYSLGKALAKAALAQGETGFGAYWAGEGAPLARELPAADVIRELVTEWHAASGQGSLTDAIQPFSL